jgi:hypothetical protein
VLLVAKKKHTHEVINQKLIHQKQLLHLLKHGKELHDAKFMTARARGGIGVDAFLSSVSVAAS